MFTSTIMAFIACLWGLFLFVGVVLKCLNAWNRHTGRALLLVLGVLVLGYVSLCVAPNAYAWRKGSSGQHTRAWYTRHGMTPPKSTTTGKATTRKGSRTTRKAASAKARNIANTQYAYCVGMSIYHAAGTEIIHVRACVDNAGKLVTNTATAYDGTQVNSTAYTSGGKLHVDVTVYAASYNHVTVTTYNGATITATQAQSQLGQGATYYAAIA